MLKEKLLQDFKEAMKEKNELRKNTIMMVRAAILQIEKDTQKEIDDGAIIDIMSKEVKKRRDSLVDFERSGREELVEQVKKEISIIKEYLPEELSLEELKKVVVDTIGEVHAESMKDMGKVMQAVKLKTAGRADGKTINEMVRQVLS